MLICTLTETSEDEKHKLEILYETYHMSMLKMANSILHNLYDAEYAVQQSFLSLTYHRDNIDEPLSSRTYCYLLVMAERKAFDIIQKNKLIECEISEDDLLDRASKYCNDDPLSKCILKLSPKYRHVIMLKYHVGYSSKEVAQIMGLTEANVIKINQRAKNKLEIYFREEHLL